MNDREMKLGGMVGTVAKVACLLAVLTATMQAGSAITVSATGEGIALRKIDSWAIDFSFVVPVPSKMYDHNKSAEAIRDAFSLACSQHERCPEQNIKLYTDMYDAHVRYAGRIRLSPGATVDFKNVESDGLSALENGKEIIQSASNAVSSLFGVEQNRETKSDLVPLYRNDTYNEAKVIAIQAAFLDARRQAEAVLAAEGCSSPRPAFIEINSTEGPIVGEPKWGWHSILRVETAILKAMFSADCAMSSKKEENK